MNSVGFYKDAVIVLPTSNENKGKNMTKKIVKIIENSKKKKLFKKNKYLYKIYNNRSRMSNFKFS